MLLNQITAFLDASLPTLIADLGALVNVDCGTYNKTGVDRVGEWIGARCAAWGWGVSACRRPNTATAGSPACGAMAPDG